ncbi:MAG: DUF192 domain-containing protein [bacterium]|nr:DUF192 domain-containing protein [bacterium]
MIKLAAKISWIGDRGSDIVGRRLGIVRHKSRTTNHASRIKNETKGTVLVQEAELADTFLSRALGLMFRKAPRALILRFPGESRLGSAIHMAFMSFGLDLVWLSSSLKVVDIREGVKPFNLFKPATWRTYLPSVPARYVLELPVGAVARSRTTVGDQIQL